MQIKWHQSNVSECVCVMQSNFIYSDVKFFLTRIFLIQEKKTTKQKNTCK